MRVRLDRNSWQADGLFAWYPFQDYRDYRPTKDATDYDGQRDASEVSGIGLTNNDMVQSDIGTSELGGRILKQGVKDTTKDIIIEDTTAFDAMFGSQGSVVLWIRNVTNDSECPIRIGFDASSDQNIHFPFADGNVYVNWLKNNRPNMGPPPFSVQDWFCAVVTTETGANNWKLYQNGNNFYSVTGNAPGVGPGKIFTGYGANWQIADIKFYRRIITPAEAAKFYNPHTRWDAYDLRDSTAYSFPLVETILPPFAEHLITGAVTITVDPTASALIEGEVITGDVTVAVVVDSQFVAPPKLFDGDVTVGITISGALLIGRSLDGNLTVPVAIASGTEFQVVHLFDGALTVQSTIASDMIIGRELVGGLTVPLAITAAFSRDVHLSGDVSISLEPTAAALIEGNVLAGAVTVQVTPLSKARIHQWIRQSAVQTSWARQTPHQAVWRDKNGNIIT